MSGRLLARFLFVSLSQFWRDFFLLGSLAITLQLLPTPDRDPGLGLVVLCLHLARSVRIRSSRVIGEREAVFRTKRVLSFSFPISCKVYLAIYLFLSLPVDLVSRFLFSVVCVFIFFLGIFSFIIIISSIITTTKNNLHLSFTLFVIIM